MMKLTFSQKILEVPPCLIFRIFEDRRTRRSEHLKRPGVIIRGDYTIILSRVGGIGKPQQTHSPRLFRRASHRFRCEIVCCAPGHRVQVVVTNRKSIHISSLNALFGLYVLLFDLKVLIEIFSELDDD